MRATRKKLIRLSMYDEECEKVLQGLDTAITLLEANTPIVTNEQEHEDIASAVDVLKLLYKTLE